MSEKRSMGVVMQLPFCVGDVRIRALREDDLSVFLGYRSDPWVARYQGWWPMDEAKARAFLREQGANAQLDSAGNWLQLAIADAATDTLLGDLGVWLSHDRTGAEIGITITPTAQGRGVGRSAMRAALAMLFADPAVTSVRADADARNTPCRRMLAAAGFREIGTADVFVKEEACIEHRYLVERGQAVPTLQGEVS
jgi:RimJ/RimL family protein N-acetyltransferase